MSKKHTTSYKSKGGMVQFYGFEELAKKLDNITESDIKRIVEEAVIKSAEPIKKDMLDFMQEHHVSGQTEESFVNIETDWNKSKCIGNVGFDIEKGGIASIFLDVGVPSRGDRKEQKPYYFIYYAVNNNANKVRQIQEEALKEILKELK